MKKKTEFLYLSEPDMIKAGVLDRKKCIDVIDEVYKLISEGDYLLGGVNHNAHGLKIDFPKESKFPNMPVAGPDRRFMAMVGYLGGRFNVCGDKWYGSHIINPERGLPRSVLMVTLNDPDTCEPIAYMSANQISSMRTGASPAVGSRYLARKDSKRVAAIGAGPISKSCIKNVLTEMTGLEELVVFDLFTEKSEAMIQEIQKEFNIKGIVAETLEEAVKDADIVSVAASRLKPVVIKYNWLKDGALVLQSAPLRADDEFWLKADIILDNPSMHMAYMDEAHESGDPQRIYDGMMAGELYKLVDDGKLPKLENFTTLGDLSRGIVEYNQEKEGVTLFISGGQAVFDLGWGYEVYKNALNNGIGQKLLLWEEPHTI